MAAIELQLILSAWQHQKQDAGRRPAGPSFFFADFASSIDFNEKGDRHDDESHDARPGCAA
jgi:hypothetical protein